MSLAKSAKPPKVLTVAWAAEAVAVRGYLEHRRKAAWYSGSLARLAEILCVRVGCWLVNSSFV